MLKRDLRIFHAPESVTEFKGCNFVTVQQSVDPKTFESLIAQAVKATPDKPVFLIDHMPAGNTVYDSDTWGVGWRRTILEKYPQVVQFSGHVHGTLANELNIWQGNSPPSTSAVCLLARCSDGKCGRQSQLRHGSYHGCL